MHRSRCRWDLWGRLIGGLVLKTAGSQSVRATDKTTASITESQTVT
jgi:hypothetical protein